MKFPGWVLTVLVILTGCAQEKGGAPRWSAFPVTLYSDKSVVATPESERDFRDAMAFWEERAGRRLFNYAGVWAGTGKPYAGAPTNPTAILANVIFRPSPWPFAGTVAGQTSFLYTDGEIHGAIVMLNSEIATCAGDCTYGYYGTTSERRVMTHELGHFLGLSHVNDVQNIMNPTVMPGGSLEGLKVDANALRTVTD
jgi:hypothetical protein